MHRGTTKNTRVLSWVFTAKEKKQNTKVTMVRNGRRSLRSVVREDTARPIPTGTKTHRYFPKNSGTFCAYYHTEPPCPSMASVMCRLLYTYSCLASSGHMWVMYTCQGTKTKQHTMTARRKWPVSRRMFFRSEERRVGKECRSRWSP